MLPLRVGLHDDDLHARHHRARRIRPVRRLRDEADVAMRFAARLVIAANHEQPGVLALRAGVRLQRHAGEAGDLRQRRSRARRTARDSPPPARAARTDGASPNSGQVTGIISAVAFSFIVHEPSGIIECVSERSRDSSVRM